MVAPEEQELQASIEVLRHNDPAIHAKAISILQEAMGAPKKGRTRRSKAEMVEARKRVYDLLCEKALVTFNELKSEGLVPTNSRNAADACDKLIASAARVHGFDYEKVERVGYKIAGEAIPEVYQRLMGLKRVSLLDHFKPRSKELTAAAEFFNRSSKYREDHHHTYVYNRIEE